MVPWWSMTMIASTAASRSARKSRSHFERVRAAPEGFYPLAVLVCFIGWIESGTANAK